MLSTTAHVLLEHSNGTLQVWFCVYVPTTAVPNCPHKAEDAINQSSENKNSMSLLRLHMQVYICTKTTPLGAFFLFNETVTGDETYIYPDSWRHIYNHHLICTVTQNFAINVGHHYFQTQSISNYTHALYIDRMH